MKNKQRKIKERNVVVLALIDREGAGGGYHSKRGYSRRQKYQDDWIEDEYNDEWSDWDEWEEWEEFKNDS